MDTDKRELKFLIKNELASIYGEQEANNIANYYLKCVKDFKYWEDDLRELKTFKPVQYVTKTAYFFEDRLYVDENVLIPRPETEELVYLTQKVLGRSYCGRIVDIGTGSGCIALALKKFLPFSTIIALDISSEALAVASKNSAILGRSITTLQLDFLSEEDRQCLGEPDCIVSNPPYVGENEKAIMSSNVLNYEPHLALFSPNSTLAFYKAISQWVSCFQTKVPHIFVEINENKGLEVKELFIKTGMYQKVELYKDMQGKDRIIYCQP